MHYQINLCSLSHPVVRIPWATGLDFLDSEASLWLYSIPHSSKTSLSELIITPFDALLWQDLWSIRMINRDEEGVLAKFADFLRERKINIVGMSSSTTDQGRNHASRLVVDCSNYSSEVDGDHTYRSATASAKLTRLEHDLALEFIHDLDFLDRKTPGISIYRNMSCWRLYDRLMRITPRPHGIPLAITQGAIRIPKNELERIAIPCARQFQADENDLGDPCALIVSNLFSDVIQISPFFRNTGIVVFAVTLDNRPGAIASVSKSLRGGGFNILGSHAWTSNRDRTNMLMLLQDRSQVGTMTPDEELVQKINDRLSSSEQLRSYNPEIRPIELQRRGGRP